MHWDRIWLFIVAVFVGAAIAGIAIRYCMQVTGIQNKEIIGNFHIKMLSVLYADSIFFEQGARLSAHLSWKLHLDDEQGCNVKPCGIFIDIPSIAFPSLI